MEGAVTLTWGKYFILKHVVFAVGKDWFLERETRQLSRGSLYSLLPLSCLAPQPGWLQAQGEVQCGKTPAISVFEWFSDEKKHH